MVTDWSKYPNFTRAEMACKHTGKCEMDPEFMQILQDIRTEYGKPMKISSGFRDPSHPAEAKKSATGEHSYGTCADIAISGTEAVVLMKIALRFGITRIGVNQKGSGRFLHLGIGGNGMPNPAIWSY